MPEGVTVRMNIGDFRRELKALGTRMERRIAARATYAAGAVFRDAAKATAPVLARPVRGRIRGALARSIYVGRERRSPRGTVGYFVGVRAKRATRRSGLLDAFYWRFLEGGWIPRGPGQRFAGGERRRALGRSRALAGGATKLQFPFLAPAFRQRRSQALAAFDAKMEEGLRDEARAGG